MNKPTVSVTATAFNDPQNAQILYASLKQQTHTPHEVIVVDNSTVQPVANEIRAIYPEANIISKPENLDFSKGSNLAMQHATGEFVLILNSDMQLAPDCIEQMLKRFESEPSLGAVVPLLLRSGENTIDTIGIAGTRARRFFNAGEGQSAPNPTTEHTYEPQFGFSGTAVMFRRSTLYTLTAFGGGREHEVFDEDFVAYKDDIDLSYRMRHAGIPFAMEPSAIAYHVRTAQEKNAETGMRRARSNKSHRVNTYSLRNHWWTLIKNEPIQNLFIHAPWILWYECKKIGFVVLFERRTLQILPSFFAGLPSILRKRRSILRNSTIRAKNLRRWFT